MFLSNSEHKKLYYSMKKSRKFLRTDFIKFILEKYSNQEGQGLPFNFLISIKTCLIQMRRYD
jgi:hypothetical protein